MTTFTGQEPLTEDAEKDLFGDLTPEEPEPTDAPEESVAELEVPEEAPEPSAEEPQPDAETAAPEEVIEGGEPEPAAETTSEAQPSVDWKKRYDDIRSQQMASLEAERNRAEMAEQLLASKLAEMESSKISPEKLQELARRAEEQGLDPANVSLYADITSEAVDARTRVYQEALQQQAAAEQAQIAQRQADAERALVDDWVSAHEDLTPEKRPEVAKLLFDIGAARFVDSNQNDVEGVAFEQGLNVQGINLKTYEPLTPDILDIAYEAVTNESLATVLRAMPSLYESDEGMQMARRLASREELTTQTAPPKAPRDTDAQLAAAETLGGPSAPAPATEESPFILPSQEVHFSK